MTGCMKLPREEEPFLTHTVFPEAISRLPEPPPVMTAEEKAAPWGEEYTLGSCFAQEGDYYRATTCFHRARHLLKSTSSASPERQAQIVRALILTYCLAGKPQEAVDVWEKERDTVRFQDKDLAEDTISLLFESYQRLNRPVDAEKLSSVLPPQDPLRERLALYATIAKDSTQLPLSLPHAEKLALEKELTNVLTQYKSALKSPGRAALYNALLPGAGYCYVGQYKTAATAFLMNGLFIASSVEFFALDLPAAGILAGGFEVGWYGGGIMGAKLAAEIYNKRVRETLFKEFLEKQSLFPLQTMHYRW